MRRKMLTDQTIQEFILYLRNEERAEATVEKYRRDAREFALWLDGREVVKEEVLTWRKHLLDSGRCPATVNAKLSALNSLFQFKGWTECRIKCLKIQRRIFRKQSRNLTRDEYKRLLAAACSMSRERILLAMETICATGIRVSELRYITAEAVRDGCVEVRLKGKIRRILLPTKLRRKLLKYAKKKSIASGEIFITRSGASVSRKQIWREMKSLCEKAGVDASKVFPHNLRHLFAILFYNTCKDIVKLADILGHSSTETTRIYLISTGEEHARWMERLDLVS